MRFGPFLQPSISPFLQASPPPGPWPPSPSEAPFSLVQICFSLCWPFSSNSLWNGVIYKKACSQTNKDGPPGLPNLPTLQNRGTERESDPPTLCLNICQWLPTEPQSPPTPRPRIPFKVSSIGHSLVKQGLHEKGAS